MKIPIYSNGKAKLESKGLDSASIPKFLGLF